jgi:hypothetical protein
MQDRPDAFQQPSDAAPLVAVLVFHGGPLHGARHLWLNCAESLRILGVDDRGRPRIARGALRPGDVGAYRIATQYLGEDDWIVDLRWIGRDWTSMIDDKGRTDYSDSTDNSRSEPTPRAREVSPHNPLNPNRS